MQRMNAHQRDKLRTISHIEAARSENLPPSSKLLTAFVSMSYVVISGALILLNKWIMVAEQFPFPMFLAGLGMGFSCFASVLFCKVLRIMPMKKTVSRWFYCTQMMPVGFFLATALATGNLTNLFLAVSLIQMLSAFTPVVTMVCAFIAGVEQPHLNLVLSVLIITGGVATASCGAAEYNWLGVVILFLSQVAESVRLVLTQTLLQEYSFNAVEGLYYTAPACTLWLALGSVIFELPHMLADNAFQRVAGAPVLFGCAAVMGFAVNVSAYFTIQLAGGLTMKILCTARSVSIVCFGVFMWAEPVTYVQIFGYVTSIAGFALFNWYKMTESLVKGAFSDELSRVRENPLQATES